MDQNLTEKPPRRVASRFELAAGRMADAWLRAGRMTVSAEDLRITRDYLLAAGWRVQDGQDGLLRVAARRSRHVLELTPEATVLLAMRQLADGS